MCGVYLCVDDDCLDVVVCVADVAVELVTEGTRIAEEQVGRQTQHTHLHTDTEREQRKGGRIEGVRNGEIDRREQ